ncbi:hypothetical protein TanjilG_08269 [Lupinus angustifolius]|uniref:DUF3527 domain-containing protein n=1 Tax=Lupinus angustifolius TaxID=3871 RepID=A0A394DB39_LUPAN|nr:PREDICTED: uncharacterized protein LOC109338078 [Lupinus angustifolius]OIW20299.1 hypothetical protein TanjilG_08269 [Lupinus angustifolius]
MPFNKKPSNELLEPAEDMGFGLEVRKISSKRQSSSKTAAKESSLMPQSYLSLYDKFESKNGIGPEDNNLKQKGKRFAEEKIQKREGVEKSAAESDELVKHMSNLPGYLLRTEKGEKFQEKAFSVGVLDWSRLEQWKHKHTSAPTSNFTSFNSSESSSRTANKSSPSVRSKVKLDNNKVLLSLGIRPSDTERLHEITKHPISNVKQIESSKSGAKSIGDDQRTTPLAFKPFEKSHSDISVEKERRNSYQKRPSQLGNIASNMRHHGVSHIPNENANRTGDGSKHNMESLQEYNHKKKERNHKSICDMGHLSVKPKHKGVSSKEMSSSSSGNGKKESNFVIGCKHGDGKPSKIVQFCHEEVLQSSSSEDFQLSESRTSPYEFFSESSQTSLSHVSFPEEDCTEDVCSKTPHSSALPSLPGLSSETMQHRISTETKMSSMNSAGPCIENDVSLDTKLRTQCVFSNLKQSLDQETAELTARRGMVNPSHNRRFSFSLNRIGRSFSFKEGSALPQFNSIYVSAKSSPVTPQSSVRWNNPSKDANNHNRAMSSPLWRLLDPIFKHKPSSDIQHPAESSQTCPGSKNSISYKTVDVNESLNAEKSKGSPVHGLLQLTIKNGLPLFKFVVSNESKIFAATTSKSLASLEKDDLGCSFTFYLVNEIKKKSGGWMSHGSKEKSCGYSYNVVARMKFSCSKTTEPINQNSRRQSLVREYILSGVEVGHTDQTQLKLIQSRELAAIVIETPFENLSDEGLHGDTSLLKKECLKCSADERCLCSSCVNGISDSTTVILSGALHGSPNTGEPSPLIYRWKNGGLCDCGGWDIGCKLLVLSNQKHGPNIPKSSKPYHDCFQLFVQEGDEQNTPIFTLSPLKDGFYSIEFNSTITHLQAFFISVVVLSCQKLPSSFEMNSMLEEILKEPSSKNNSRLQGKAPMKYSPTPPLSPVGRV